MYKSRGYKRETPQNLKRDYRLFVIACEGSKTEPSYFKVLKEMSSRIAIDIIEESVKDEEVNNPNKSSPKWVLDRATKYIEKEGLDKEDELWFVMDIDRWDKEQIREIANYCDQEENWNIALSNPCFEVWLYFHRRKELSKSNNCKEFKHEISTFDNSGYNSKNFIYYIKDALNNSKNQDLRPNYYMPSPKTTKVYKLIESLMKMTSKSEFDNFISQLNK